MLEMKDKPYKIDYISKCSDSIDLNGFTFDVRDVDIIELKEKVNKIYQFDENLLEI
jgi:hypothetical protein